MKCAELGHGEWSRRKNSGLVVASTLSIADWTYVVVLVVVD